MTCVVGLVHDGQVFMGGDSCGSDGVMAVGRFGDKVIRKGDWVMGGAGDGFLATRFFECDFPQPPSGDAELSLTVKGMAKNLKALSKSVVRLRRGEAQVLLGVRDKLFFIDTDGDSMSIEPYWAIGSGHYFAMGALHATSGNPEVRVTKALKAAVDLAMGVKPPLKIISTDQMGKQ